MVDFVCLAMPQSQFDMIVGLEVADNTSHKIRRTRKMIKIDSKNALRGLKFDTEEAQI